MTGLFIFCGTVALQAQPPSKSSRFKQWDKDRNHKLTHAEFYEGMKNTGIFEAWDHNGDNLLDRQEVYAGSTRMQQMTEEASGSRVAIQVVQEGGFISFASAGREVGFSFREVDLNRDGTLDKTEFFTALFRLWDQEKRGFLRSHELKEAQLRQWHLV